MTPTDAARELEHARQTVRDLQCAGKPVTDIDRQRVAAAESTYDGIRGATRAATP